LRRQGASKGQILKIGGRPAESRTPADARLAWADISKAQRLLGYRPLTPVEEGLKRLLAWYRAADPNRRA
jgi:nucleoside-diphosphate-sugar epimerase